MRFKIVPSTADGRQQLLTTYLINDTLAIDAGAIAIGLDQQAQLKIRSIVITHSHLDHIFSLPLYLTDLFDELREPVAIYATPSDYEAIKKYLFHERVWIPLHTMRNDHTELIAHHPIRAGESFMTEGLKITPVAVTHTILTHGLLVEDDRDALLFTSDTGPTDAIWQLARECDKLRAIFIDLSFPSRLTWLARTSCHHSPETLVEELPKIGRDIPIYAIHLKPAYRDQVVAELEALQNPRIRVAEIGREYEF
ncbi:MAG: MBL fold metallo-hydrolase [Blastocatellia bacterium]|nr:MBL fold metallo-hydrolase [Blastocatellia bacterium]